MTGQHARDVTWLVSGHDLQQHAFHKLGEDGNASEALCTHSVPAGRLTKPEDAPPGSARCIACLLIFGGDLADQYDDPQWRG